MKKICTIGDCGRAVHARGLCNRHYQRFLDGLDPAAPPRKPGPKPAQPCVYPGCERLARVGEGCNLHWGGWAVRCGRCLQLLGPMPKSGQPWALIEAHRCGEVA